MLRVELHVPGVSLREVQRLLRAERLGRGCLC